MRKLIYSLMVSLDGFIAGPNGELDWVIIDEELHRFVNDQQRDIGAHLYGRRTWEVMAAHWPTADRNPAAPAFEVEFARIWQAMPKIVVSTTLKKVEGNARLVKENVVEVIRALKAQPGGDINLGGAGLAASLMPHGLIDEYELTIQPVILGKGIPMFPEMDAKIALKLVETRTFGTGVHYLRYQSAAAESEG